MGEKKSSSPPTPQQEIALEDLLVNLQKSFSRVSSRSASIPETQARSIIYGDVDFTIELNVEGEKDKLLVRKNGSVNLSLSGKISTDIRDEEID